MWVAEGVRAICICVLCNIAVYIHVYVYEPPFSFQIPSLYMLLTVCFESAVLKANLPCVLQEMTVTTSLCWDSEADEWCTGSTWDPVQPRWSVTD